MAKRARGWYHQVFGASFYACRCTPRVPIVQRPRTWPFQGQNTGSNPVGDAKHWTNSTKPDRLIIGLSMAPDLEHEAAFIRAFITPSKRERLVELLGKPKRRRDILRTLYHFADLDPRFISRVPAADDSVEGIEALLRSKGAPNLCYAISIDSDLDGRTVALGEALTRIHGLGSGTLLSCVPGSLGYFEGEGIGARYVLERRSGRTLR